MILAASVFPSLLQSTDKITGGFGPGASFNIRTRLCLIDGISEPLLLGQRVVLPRKSAGERILAACP